MNIKKRIFITGAAGFIGFHSGLKFIQRGNFVVGLDNFNSYYDPQLKRDRANELQKQGIEVIEGDIADKENLRKIVKKHNITHILHLAAQAGVRYSLIHPEEYIESNVKGFFNILEVCREFPEISLVYASSSSVYGLNTAVPFSEEDQTEKPASLYGATKKTNELMAHAYHHLFGFSVKGLRFFTVYGPWGRPDMAYFSFAKAILEDFPLRLFNNGKTQRDFTYIEDITEGIASAIDGEKECAVYNLGNNRPEDVKYLVELLENKIGKKAKIELMPHQPGDVFYTYADIQKSQTKLNFFPQISLAEGVSRFIDWYTDYRKK